jgi:membrane-associated phospholipid phosphatase
MSNPMSEQYDDKLAWTLSVLGHPFLMVPATVALALVGSTGAPDAYVVGVIGGGSVLAALGAWLGLRLGWFNDFDVSERTRRPRFYLLTVSITLLMAAVFRADPIGCRATLVAAGLLGACGLANRWIKASLHVAFGAYVVGLWWLLLSRSDELAPTQFRNWGALWLAAFACAVAWSRVRIRRHTLPEVIVGGLLGIGAALLLVG